MCERRKKYWRFNGVRLKVKSHRRMNINWNWNSNENFKLWRKKKFYPPIQIHKKCDLVFNQRLTKPNFCKIHNFSPFRIPHLCVHMTCKPLASILRNKKLFWNFTTKLEIILLREKTSSFFQQKEWLSWNGTTLWPLSHRLMQKPVILDTMTAETQVMFD